MINPDDLIKQAKREVRMGYVLLLLCLVGILLTSCEKFKL